MRLEALVEDYNGVARHYATFVSQLQKTIETKDKEILTLKEEIAELKDQRTKAVGQQQTVGLNTALYGSYRKRHPQHDSSIRGRSITCTSTSKVARLHEIPEGDDLEAMRVDGSDQSTIDRQLASTMADFRFGKSPDDMSIDQSQVAGSTSRTRERTTQAAQAIATTSLARSRLFTEFDMKDDIQAFGCVSYLRELAQTHEKKNEPPEKLAKELQYFFQVPSPLQPKLSGNPSRHSGNQPGKEAVEKMLKVCLRAGLVGGIQDYNALRRLNPSRLEKQLGRRLPEMEYVMNHVLFGYEGANKYPLNFTPNF